MTDLLESPDSLGLVSICRIYGSVTGWLTPIPRIIMFSSKTFGVEKQNSRRKGMIFGNSHFSSVCAHCAVGKHHFWREFYRIGCGWVVVCCCVQKGGDYWTVNPLSVRRRPRFAKEWFAGKRRRLKLNFTAKNSPGFNWIETKLEIWTLRQTAICLFICEGTHAWQFCWFVWEALSGGFKFWANFDLRGKRNQQPGCLARKGPVLSWLKAIDYGYELNKHW